LTVDALAIGIQIVSSGAGASPGTLVFSNSIGSPFTNASNPGQLAIVWASGLGVMGSRTLGTVGLAVPSNARAGQSYLVSIKGVSAADMSGHLVKLSTGPDTSVTIRESGPTIFPGGIVDAARFSNQLSGGLIVSVFGTSLATSEAFANSVPLPKTLGGVTVSANGTLAPLFYVSPAQV